MLIVIGTAVPIMAVQRITARTVCLVHRCRSGLSWRYRWPLARPSIGSARSRRAGLLRALDLWFAGHLPYSLWLLTTAAAFAAAPWASLDLLIVLAVIPAVWTAVIVAAFCRHVLGTSRAGARWRAAVHFVVMWAIALELVALSAGGWFQITRAVTRFFMIGPSPRAMSLALLGVGVMYWLDR